jgi:hypothetical protein
MLSPSCLFVVASSATAAARGEAASTSGCFGSKMCEEPLPTGADRAARERAFCLNRPFQVVLGMHRARSQILEYFDLSPTKALARIDADGELVVEAQPVFVHALRHMAFHVRGPRTIRDTICCSWVHSQ